MTTDLKAIHHVLFNSYDYPIMFEVVSHVIREVLGSGAFCCINWGMH